MSSEIGGKVNKLFSGGLDWLGCVESPLRGPEGNVEFLAWWRKGVAKEV